MYSLMDYVTEYQNDGLCQKFNNNIPLSELDGDYLEVYVTESSRPYDLQAIYHPLSYYLEG